MKKLKKWLIVNTLSRLTIAEIFSYSLSAMLKKYDEICKKNGLNPSDYKAVLDKLF